MAGGSRSRLGCWSCRLRRKKCDEKRPECATCEGLGVRCHGYGQRPDWMDGGEKEKAAAADMRRDIKAAARREPNQAPDQSNRSNSNASSSHQSPNSDRNPPPEKEFANIALHESPQKDNTSNLATVKERTKSKTEPKSDSAVLQLCRKENLNGLDEETTIPVISNSIDFALPQALKGREASLLMYYLDYVFPLQFRMYRPTAAEGGRGWLLSLMLRTPPMYHMTLALSAYCFETVEVPNGAKERKQASLALLGSAMQNLHQYIRAYTQEKESRSLEDSIKVFGCILQFTAFIAFTGGIDNWQVHMKGASEFVPGLIDALDTSTSHPEMSPSPRSPMSSHASDVDSLVNEDKITLKFLLSIFVWLDITACIASGSSPSLGEQHESLLGGLKPHLRMEKLNGVQNWTMVVIAKIATLDAWKRASQLNGTLSVIELVKRATQLEVELKESLARTSLGDQYTTSHSLGLPYLTPLSAYSDYVTELYSSAALTYLHVIVSGPYPELPEIRENVGVTLEILRRLPNTFLPRATWWPLLVTGSMVMPEEQAFIRNIFIAAGVNDSTLGCGHNILKVLKECWRRRSNNDPIPPLGEGYWGDMMSTMHLKVLVM